MRLHECLAEWLRRHGRRMPEPDPVPPDNVVSLDDWRGNVVSLDDWRACRLGSVASTGTWGR